MPSLPRCAALIAVLALAPLVARADPVLVFAAASLRTALEPIAADWQARTGNTVTVSYAGSGLLARQIIAGAPAGVFVSASEEWMDAVDHAGLLVPGSRHDLLGNRLVLIGHGPQAPVTIGPGLDLGAMLGNGRLAMALVDAVPAGQYGKAALLSLGLWDKVAGRIAQADNVRAALALVATGEAPLGIVYATDAAAEPAVGVLGIFPEASHPPITYPVALIDGVAGDADRDFVRALSLPPARAIFAAQGFTMAPGR